MSEIWKERLGRRLRELRRARDLTLKALAERARLSVRFLSEVEAGRANPSLASLRDLAGALEVDVLAFIVDEPRSGTHAELHALIDALDPAAAAEALRLLREARLDGRLPTVALLGLRGAGKSSVGERLAARLQRPFIELDRLIEREAGMDLGDLFELHGEERVRQLERRVLERVLEGEPAVLATGGGLVTHPESWALLQARTLTVWLKASPQEHWDRVIAQGDLRPMANRSRARAELEALYEARAPLYARAHVVVETSHLDVEEVAARVAELAGARASSG